MKDHKSGCEFNAESYDEATTSEQPLSEELPPPNDADSKASTSIVVNDTHVFYAYYSGDVQIETTSPFSLNMKDESDRQRVRQNNKEIRRAMGLY